jgi:hypothetical protein
MVDSGGAASVACVGGNGHPPAVDVPASRVGLPGQRRRSFLRGQAYDSLAF